MGKPYQIMKQWALCFAQPSLNDLWVSLLKAADDLAVPMTLSRFTAP